PTQPNPTTATAQAADTSVDTSSATTETTSAPATRNDIRTVVLPAVKDEKPAFGSPDAAGDRWAQIARPDGVKVFVITKEGRQINNTAPTAEEAKQNILAYLAEID
ncbi:hypothetical protein CTI14_13605, partial [Methylobacterium radiotolerans]